MQKKFRRVCLAGLGMAAMLAAFAAQAQQPYYAAHHMPFDWTSTSGFTGGFGLSNFAGDDLVIANLAFASKGGVSSSSGLWNISNPSSPALVSPSDMRVIDVNASGQVLSTTSANPTQFSVGTQGLGGSGFVASSLNDQGVVAGANNGVGHWYNVHTKGGGQFQPFGYVDSVISINNQGLLIAGSYGNFVYDTNTGQSLAAGDGARFMALNDENQLLVKVHSGPTAGLYLQTDPWGAVGSGINLTALPGAPALSSLSFNSARMNNHGQVIVDNWFFTGNEWLDMGAYFGPQKGKLTLLAISDSAEILAQFAPTMPTGSFYQSITTSYVFKPSDTYLAAQFVPEPASMALMGLGLAGVAWAVRRQRTGLPRHA